MSPEKETGMGKIYCERMGLNETSNATNIWPESIESFCIFERYRDRDNI
jgi:hypothetical protein